MGNKRSEKHSDFVGSAIIHSVSATISRTLVISCSQFAPCTGSQSCMNWCLPTQINVKPQKTWSTTSHAVISLATRDSRGGSGKHQSLTIPTIWYGPLAVPIDTTKTLEALIGGSTVFVSVLKVSCMKRKILNAILSTCLKKRSGFIHPGHFQDDQRSLTPFAVVRFRCLCTNFRNRGYFIINSHQT